MRAVRAGAILLALPLTGCIMYVDEGGKTALGNRMNKVERRIYEIEKSRGFHHRPPDGVDTPGKSK